MKIACPSYLNTQPLVFGLEEIGYEIHYKVPSELETCLSSGQVDLALVPAAILAKHPEWIIHDFSCIACEGPVLSVQLFQNKSDCPIEATTSIYLDSASRTSQALTKILLKEKWALNLDKIKFENQTNSDWELIIGDPALLKYQQSDIQSSIKSSVSIDLGQAWLEHTDLPFVFAVWVSIRELSSHEKESLIKAKEQGLANIEKIANKQNIVEKKLAQEYLERYIHYDLNERCQKALQLFLTKLKTI